MLCKLIVCQGPSSSTTLDEGRYSTRATAATSGGRIAQAEVLDFLFSFVPEVACRLAARRRNSGSESESHLLIHLTAPRFWNESNHVLYYCERRFRTSPGINLPSYHAYETCLLFSRRLSVVVLGGSGGSSFSIVCLDISSFSWTQLVSVFSCIVLGATTLDFWAVISGCACQDPS